MMHPQAKTLAQAYVAAPIWTPSSAYKLRMQEWVLDTFETIPLRVVYRQHEVNSYGELDHCRRVGGVLLVMRRPWHPLLGACMAQWRAVHDWFGHLEPGNSFGLAGELAAWEVHERTMPTEYKPFAWQNVILENAYLARYGEYPPMALKFDSAKFGERVWGEE